MNIVQLRRTIARHRIVYGVVIALVVSMALYISSGASRLDLSRPGYEKARKEITKDTDKATDFSSTGAIDASTLGDFQKRLDKRRTELNGLGTFTSSALDDNQLQIVPRDSSQPSL